jgi:hypothetical protein
MTGIVFRANGRTFYRVPFRAGVYSTFRDWLLGTFWCHVVRRMFPTASCLDLTTVGPS